VKTRGMKIRTVMAALALVCFAAAGAQAQVQLRFDPPDTTVAVGQPCRMSIVLDDTLRIRTIDVTVDYDTTVVRSLGGGAGTLYTSSGVFTFQGFEEDVPGQWHGYAVLMGAGLYIQGPGELYYWEFEGLIDGRSPVTTVSVYLSTTDGSWFESVELPGAQVTVGAGPTSSVDDLPGVRALRGARRAGPGRPCERVGVRSAGPPAGGAAGRLGRAGRAACGLGRQPARRFGRAGRHVPVPGAGA
jgi:hypothetical protein